MKKIKQTIAQIYSRIKGYFHPADIDVQTYHEFKKRGISPFFSFKRNPIRANNKGRTKTPYFNELKGGKEL